MADNTQKIKEYINEQMAQIDFRTKAYVFDNNNTKRPNRNIFVKIQSHLDKFIAGNSAFRWVSLTGLRGAGKTTVMYQLYDKNKKIDGYFLTISMDEVVQTLGGSISEIIRVFEEMIGRPISNLDKPLFLFIDEVQYDPNWGLALKAIYDKSNKVFIFTTGSAAVLMNMNPDVARRAIPEKIYPLSFTEFIKIKHGKYEIKGLSADLRNALFQQEDARGVYSRLNEKKATIDKYLLDISRLDFENYLNYGSLPFMIALDNEAIVYEQINKSLERVVFKDIPQIDGFSSEIVNKVPAILYAIADMDAFNFSTLANKFEISRVKISEIFSVLEKTEILNRIYPYGSHFNQVTKKPSKYLFSSPAFRSMYYKFIGNTISAENARGKLLEDLAGMYLHRLINTKPGFSLVYDSAKGGADFIIRTQAGEIAIEVGAGNKDYRQVAATSRKINAKYGLVISNDDLHYSETNNAVKIPLRYFLLI